MGALKVKKAGTFQAVGETAWFTALPSLHHSTGFATATASATAHTKGNWAQLVSSTSATTSALLIRVSDVAVSGTDTATLLDIGVGAAGSETAVISNVAVGGAHSLANNGVYFMVPVKVDSGSRISARIQAKVTTPQTARVEVWAFNVGNADLVSTTVDVLGTSTATSEGTAMSGASGTYVQVVASTSQAYKAVVVVPSTSEASMNSITGITYTVAVGASGAESDIGRLTFNSSSAEAVFSTISGFISSLVTGTIPAGSRLTVKHNLESTPGRFDVTLIGIPAV
jgi:hypothetical protein